MTTPVQPAAELAHDILRSRRQPLDVFFTPRTVAVIGATEKAGSVGRTVLWNLIGSPFGGTVFPVNPKRPSVLGIKAYPSIAGRAGAGRSGGRSSRRRRPCPALIGECAAAGVKGAIIISAGFKEIGPGRAPSWNARSWSRRGASRMRIIGPNCLGVMSPRSGLNATFAAGMARPGNVGFISQSGALLHRHPRLELAGERRLQRLRLDRLDARRRLGRPDRLPGRRSAHAQHRASTWNRSATPASFLSAAREVALTKPIIVIKAGRTEAAAKAAASHTGSLTGSDEVLDAAFRRGGVLRVNTIADLFYMAEVLAKQPRPRGPALTIVTNAGGPGVLATDALIASGGELAQLSPETPRGPQPVAPAPVEPRQPDRHPGRRRPRALCQGPRDRRQGPQQRRPAGDPHAAGHDRSDPAPPSSFEAVRHEARQADPGQLDGRRPASRPARTSSTRPSIPTFAYPDTAARAFNYMWRYSYNLRGLYETPELPGETATMRPPDREPWPAIIQGVRQSGRTLLTEVEVEAAAGCLRHPDRGNAPSPPTEAEAVRAGRQRSATRSCSSSIPRPSPTRPTSAACS